MEDDSTDFGSAFDVGNDTTIPADSSSASWFSNTFSAFGNLATAAAPVVASLTGRRSSTSPTTAGLAAGSGNSILIIVAIVGVAILGFVLFVGGRK